MTPRANWEMVLWILHRFLNKVTLRVKRLAIPCRWDGASAAADIGALMFSANLHTAIQSLSSRGTAHPARNKVTKGTAVLYHLLAVLNRRISLSDTG
mmetsp:Transcript_70163/g.121479  ORF Transcript_70163/g.121479 Transcript_70163/m.121479 type:complete len:97 (-) Transcript_70163:44-334(-)